ncbi:FHA domain-containing protein [Candidatus Latescibacterota bacterium]
MYLFILNGKSEGKQIKLKHGKCVIGRSSKADIVLDDDKFASGINSAFNYNKNGKITIEDLNSSNGTFVLGEEIVKPTEIKHGDIINVGHTFIKISRRSSERYSPSETEGVTTPEAIIVVDIVGSSKIAQALGDQVASKIKNFLFQKLNKNLLDHPAEFLKNTGDGFMIIITKPLDAVNFCINLLKDTRGDGSYKSFHIRIGIHYGETSKLSDGDRRGLAVDMAFRIESVKTGDLHQTVMGVKKDVMPRVDRIFISEVVHRMIASNKSIKSRCIGYFDLKGFTGRHKIFEVLI